MTTLRSSGFVLKLLAGYANNYKQLASFGPRLSGGYAPRKGMYLWNSPYMAEKTMSGQHSLCLTLFLIRIKKTKLIPRIQVIR